MVFHSQNEVRNPRGKKQIKPNSKKTNQEDKLLKASKFHECIDYIDCKIEYIDYKNKYKVFLKTILQYESRAYIPRDNTNWLQPLVICQKQT